MLQSGHPGTGPSGDAELAIRVDGLSKRYQIGPREPYRALRDVLARAAQAPFRRLGRPRPEASAPAHIWALRDVSFDVRRGEVVGIIGRNGAGKSTLLKLLSRIIVPTAGEAEIYGRVGTLLEVGTGFHPELTGRENIYLNGAILGMKRRDIGARLDRILEFAEVEVFADTPVKHYSSGMYVRLAFAVAAHLEPDILLVDEVLAVGDASFQRKCIGKMGDIAKQGRTVLFVSHNLLAVAQFCERVVVLDQGRVSVIDEPERAIERYLSSLGSPHHTSLRERTQRRGAGPIRFTSFRCETDAEASTYHLIAGRPARLVLGYEAGGPEPIRQVTVAIAIYTILGHQVTNLSNYYFRGYPFDVIPPGGEFVCEVPKLPLRSGRYVAELYCAVDGEVSDWLEQAVMFDVTDGDYYGTGMITRHVTGSMFMEHRWSLRAP